MVLGKKLYNGVESDDWVVDWFGSLSFNPVISRGSLKIFIKDYQRLKNGLYEK